MDKEFFIDTKGGCLKTPNAEDFRCVVDCLLCGDFVEVPQNSLGVAVCQSCKDMWRKLKEKDNG